MTTQTPFETLMAQGAEHHAAGRAELALVQFERALALEPANVNAASACASMLSLAGQPEAAFQLLDRLGPQLLADADGATNYAVAAENIGRVDLARAAYARALELDPDHVRALNNTALTQASEGDFDLALEKLSRCRQLAPDDPATWLNLADILIAARRFGQAQALLTEAGIRFTQPEFSVRLAIALSFGGEIEQAQSALDRLDAAGQAMLTAMVDGANRPGERLIRKPLHGLPDAYELFCQQAYDAMQVCDWRDHDRLTAVLRETLARAVRTGQGRDWRDAQLMGLMLPLHEDEIATMRRLSIAAIGRNLRSPMAPFVPGKPASDGRIRVGLAVQSLRDPRVGNALQQQLAMHDHARFAIHVYSPTPEPDLAATRQLARECASAVEIAHMSDDEAVGRMRLDQLDIFIDMAFDTPWCRPEIPERRVAPIQIRQTTWHRHHPSRPCEYNMSDTFVHPDGLDLEPYGAVVRLPNGCWLATNNDQAQGSAPSRADLGLPADALVLCAFVPPLMVDPQSFGLWMKLLKALPNAVLWLPAYGRLARANLHAAAQLAHVEPARIVFQQPCTRAEALARIASADLFVDTLRFNANQGLVDALRMGVPALSCAGQNMASRLGGSILHAAGMADCVFDTVSALSARVVQLGRDPAALQALRASLAGQLGKAALFNPQARVREWESAWTTMVERYRAGQAPAAFDVAPVAPVSG